VFNLPLVREIEIKCMKEAMHLVTQDNVTGEIPPKILFVNVAELHEKLKINIQDILLVETDEYDSRNKMVYIKGKEEIYTIMNIPFKRLLSCSDTLLMVNKFTLISADAVNSYKYDCITLKSLFVGWKNKQVTLHPKYREVFYKKVGK
jgi:hypothetical protein